MSYKPVYSETVARAHIQQCKVSGMSMADYCRKHAIRPTTFYSWNKKYKNQPTTESIKNDPQFVTIPIKQIPGNAESIRIVRTEIDVPVGVASDMCTVLTSLLGDRGGARCLG